MIFTHTDTSFSRHSRWKRDSPEREKSSNPFQVSIWKKRTRVRADYDFNATSEVEFDRACVEYSRFNWSTKTWNKQSIWCDPEELEYLLDALNMQSIKT